MKLFNSLNLFRPGLAGILLCLSLCGAARAGGTSGVEADLPVYIGTDTGPGKGAGIYLTHLDAATGTLSAPRLVAETANPTFLALHPSRKFLFAVNGVSRFNGKRDGSVTGFSIDGATGNLTAINQASSGGVGPCHLSIAGDGKHLFIANYSGGGFAVVPVDGDGKLAEPSCVIQDDQSDPKRRPHGHCIQPDPTGRFVLADDLGLAKIFVFRFDPAKGVLTANDPAAAETARGAGPRHVAFHPNGKWVYNINESNSTMTAYAWDAERGGLRELQTLSTLPPDFKDKSSCAELLVHPDGQFLYGSNRGGDSIAVFKIDAGTGKLSPVGYAASGGKTPRSFTLDPAGNWLLTANQDSGNVAVFKVDAKSGELTPTGQKVAVPVPVCVVFAPK